MIYADSLDEVGVIKTGLFLDKLTGIGGIPKGYILELFGDESIGKTSLSLQAIAAAQQQGLRCLFVDVEWSYENVYAASLGVDNSKVGLIRDQVAETILDEVIEAVESKQWDLIVLDSVGGLSPRAEIEKAAGEKTIGGQAGLMARFCRKIVPLLKINNVALVVLNHSFVDIMSGKILTSGGKKLQYHKSISIRLKAKQGVVIKQGDRKVGKVVVGEVKKNKLAATEGLEVDGQLIFGVGFSAAADLLGDAIDRGVIVKKGNTYYLGEEKLGLGLSKTRKMIEEDEVLMAKIKALVWLALTVVTGWWG